MERVGGKDQSSFRQTLRQAQGEREVTSPLTLALSREGRGDQFGSWFDRLTTNGELVSRTRFASPGYVAAGLLRRVALKNRGKEPITPIPMREELGERFAFIILAAAQR